MQYIRYRLKKKIYLGDSVFGSRLQSYNMESNACTIPDDYYEKEPDTKASVRKQSISRSMSVPNTITNTIIFPTQEEEAIPSVTISDFSSHESTNNPKVCLRHNSLPKNKKSELGCRIHGRRKPSLSPAFSLSDLVNDELLRDAEPETP